MFAKFAVFCAGAETQGGKWNTSPGCCVSSMAYFLPDGMCSACCSGGLHVPVLQVLRRPFHELAASSVQLISTNCCLNAQYHALYRCKAGQYVCQNPDPLSLTTSKATCSHSTLSRMQHTQDATRPSSSYWFELTQAHKPHHALACLHTTRPGWTHPLRPPSAPPPGSPQP